MSFTFRGEKRDTIQDKKEKLKNQLLEVQRKMRAMKERVTPEQLANETFLNFYTSLATREIELKEEIQALEIQCRILRERIKP